MIDGGRMAAVLLLAVLVVMIHLAEGAATLPLPASLPILSPATVLTTLASSWISVMLHGCLHLWRSYAELIFDSPVASTSCISPKTVA
jgi:hypothetical protein